VVILETVCMLETYYRFEEFISNKENEIYEEISINIDEYLRRYNQRLNI
jgi:hypothetical protein